MKGARSIHIGTSGWHYDHWRGPFYPDNLAKDRWLAHYAERFSTVEINNSFYRLPAEKTLRQWRDTVHAGFTFSVKASRYITHIKKLKDPSKTVPPLLDRVRVLEQTLGPILFQLPPSWRCNHERLASFLDALPTDLRYVFEFRNPSWFSDETYRLLSAHGAAFCIFELDDLASPRQVTGGFAYIRLHGPGGPYQGSYDTRALAGWAGAFSAWARRGAEVYCYFDNDEAGYAAQNAGELAGMTG